MPTAHTVGTIYNLALDTISQNPCNGPSDTGRPEARWLNRNYAHYVQAALRELAPDFAVELHQLDQAGDTPEYKWKYFYDLPNGWLRVLPPTLYGDRGQAPLSYRVLSNRLLMNESGPRPVEIVMDRQEPGQWDPLFASYVAASLARGMANRFTHKAGIIQLAGQAVAEAREAMIMVGSYEGSADPIEQHDIIRMRGLD